MRIQITIPTDLAERLQRLAVQEHRSLREQAEMLLYRAIEDAGISQEASSPQGLTHPKRRGTVQSQEFSGRRVIGRKEVLEKKIPVSPTTLWRMWKYEGFPQPVRLSANRVGWFEDEIDRWLASRPRGTETEGNHAD